MIDVLEDPNWLVLVGPHTEAEHVRRRIGHPKDRTIVVASPADTRRLRGLSPLRTGIRYLDGAQRLEDYHLIYVEVTYLQQQIDRARESDRPASHRGRRLP